MNQPHKHKDFIIAWANGAEIEWCHAEDIVWYPLGNPPCWDDAIEYRIKPEPEYPKTNMSMHQFNELIMSNTNLPTVRLMVLAGNAAIKQAVIDGDVIINTDKVK